METVLIALIGLLALDLIAFAALVIWACNPFAHFDEISRHIDAAGGSADAGAAFPQALSWTFPPLNSAGAPTPAAFSSTTSEARNSECGGGNLQCLGRFCAKFCTFLLSVWRHLCL